MLVLQENGTVGPYPRLTQPPKFTAPASSRSSTQSTRTRKSISTVKGSMRAVFWLRKKERASTKEEAEGEDEEESQEVEVEEEEAEEQEEELTRSAGGSRDACLLPNVRRLCAMNMQSLWKSIATRGTWEKSRPPTPQSMNLDASRNVCGNIFCVR